MKAYQSTRMTRNCTNIYTHHLCVNDFISHSVFVFSFTLQKIHLSENVWKCNSFNIFILRHSNSNSSREVLCDDNRINIITCVYSLNKSKNVKSLLPSFNDWWHFLICWCCFVCMWRWIKNFPFTNLSKNVTQFKLLLKF